MRIQLLRSMKGEYGRGRRGDIVTVTDRAARSLLERGLATMVTPVKRPKSASKPKAKAATKPKVEQTHPLDGSRDGAGTPSSSSAAGQAPAGQGSTE